MAAKNVILISRDAFDNIIEIMEFIYYPDGYMTPRKVKKWLRCHGAHRISRISYPIGAPNPLE